MKWSFLDMIVRSFLAISLAMLFIPPRSSAANLLDNGSFESPSISSSWNFTGDFSFAGWSGFSTGSGNGGGNAGITFGTDFGLSPADGNQAFSFNGDNPPAGSFLEQTFTTTPGLEYQVTFAVGRNNGFSDQMLGLRSDIFDGSDALLFSENFQPPATVSFATELFSFFAASTTCRIRFTDISGPNPNTDVFLDAVSVVQVPEPSYLSFIALIGALACVRRPRWPKFSLPIRRW
jgi:hypothetical protein